MWGAKYPIVLAPMGGVGTPELAAAVCNAGGLGSLAAAYLSPAQITDQIARLRRLTDQPFAVNLFVHDTPPLDRDPAPVLALLATYHKELGIAPPHLPSSPAERFEEQVAAVLAARVPVFSFTFGIPDQRFLESFRAMNTLLVGTATTVEEARALADAGMDAIAAQGAEAGAHRGTFLGRFEDAMVPTAKLVSQCAAAIALPVLAAGGIRDGDDVARMMGHGAAGVQIGTAFVPCPESATPNVYKQALLAGAGVGDTVVTRAFSGRPARGLPNRLIREMEAQPGDRILPFPWQNAATRPLRAAASRAGAADFLSLWAGEGSKPLRAIPAAELMERIIKEASF